jgi:hypothetical protein
MAKARVERATLHNYQVHIHLGRAGADRPLPGLILIPPTFGRCESNRRRNSVLPLPPDFKLFYLSGLNNTLGY